MGTNFYWLESALPPERRDEDREGIQVHIGKRSAAGSYCWDCGTTLCSEGTRQVHYTKSNRYIPHPLSRATLPDTEWLSQCPSCGKGLDDEGLSEGSAGVELGFQKAHKVRKTGVGSCCSFSWTLMRHKWELEALAESELDILIKAGFRNLLRDEAEDETAKAELHKQRERRGLLVVENEYGDEFSAMEFLQSELSHAAIEFQCPYVFF